MVLHHVQGFIVEEGTVFEGIDASANGAFGRFGAVAMCGNFAF